MTKERIPISGDLKSKVKQLMEYAGWREGRKVDISIAEQYYTEMLGTVKMNLLLNFNSTEYYQPGDTLPSIPAEMIGPINEKLVPWIHKRPVPIH